jgi:NADPH:quinone reductase-like Zn-dependent oxidoreductase
MYAVELTAPSLGSFHRTSRADPVPAAGQVLVRMLAASLNFIDLAIATGKYPVDRFPLVPVCDGAGEVAAIGPDVEGFAVGQRVIPHSKPLWVGGPIEAANSSVMRGIALQLAKEAGATVILTSSSEEKLQRAQRLGADVTINYRSTPAWDKEVLALTQGRGADLVLETVGPETFERSVNAVAYGGTLFVIGFVSGTRGQVDLLPIIVKALKVQGNNTGSVADLRDVARAIAAGGIKPVIDQTFALDETAQAYARLASGGRHFGKIAIVH